MRICWEKEPKVTFDVTANSATPYNSQEYTRFFAAALYKQQSDRFEGENRTSTEIKQHKSIVTQWLSTPCSFQFKIRLVSRPTCTVIVNRPNTLACFVFPIQSDHVTILNHFLLFVQVVHTGLKKTNFTKKNALKYFQVIYIWKTNLRSE